MKQNNMEVLNKPTQTIDKTYLYTDIDMFNKFKKIEDELKNVVSELKEIHLKVLGLENIENYKEYLSNPVEYLVQKYWNAHCKNMAIHLDKKAVVKSHTNVDYHEVITLFNKWYALNNNLREFAPKININSIIYKVKEERFQKFLNHAKENHYKALERFIDSYYKLSNYEDMPGLMFMPRISRNITTKNLKLEINKIGFHE